MDQRISQKQTVRRAFLRMLFVARIDGDRELDVLTRGAASALRVGRAEVERALAKILSQFDELLVPLVRDKLVLEAVGASSPTTQQLTQLSKVKVRGDDYAAARKFFAETFGDESFAHRNIDTLTTRRVEELVRRSS